MSFFTFIFYDKNLPLNHHPKRPPLLKTLVGPSLLQTRGRNRQSGLTLPFFFGLMINLLQTQVHSTFSHPLLAMENPND